MKIKIEFNDDWVDSERREFLAAIKEMALGWVPVEEELVIEKV